MFNAGNAKGMLELLDPKKESKGLNNYFYRG